MNANRVRWGSESGRVTLRALRSASRVRLFAASLVVGFLAAASSGLAQEASQADRPTDGSRQENSSPAAASSPQPTTAAYRAGHSPSEVQRWIEQLGHDSYLVRETAAKQLVETGEVALGELQVAADSFDPEVRARAARVLAQVSEAVFQRRLDDFLADASGELGVTLPGWEQFRQIVADSPQSRELYVTMQRSEGPLLKEVLTGDRFDAIQQFQMRLVELQSAPRIVLGDRLGEVSAWPGLGTCATALFIDCLPVAQSGGQGPRGVAELALQSAMRAAVESSAYREPLRSLLSHWVLLSSRANPMDVQQKIAITRTYELQKALPVMVAIARGDEPFSVQPATFRTEALLTAAVLCGEEGRAGLIDQLELLLEDSTVAYRGRNGRDDAVVEMRDVALAVLVQLSGQDLREYGLRSARRDAEMFFAPASLIFNNDESRTGAIEKWRRWRQSEPQTEAG